MTLHIQSTMLHSEKYPATDHYPFNLPLFHETKRILFQTPVTLFAGENGTGKSTLLEAIARTCGIYIWRNLARTRFKPNPFEEKLAACISVEWRNGSVPGAFFGSADFQHFTRILDEWAAADPGQLDYFGGKSLVTQSHGQSMMSFFRTRYRIKGLYLMDEPETALSPRSQLELLDIIKESSGAGHAQFIIATHSPILLACPGAVIYSFDHSPIEHVAYEDTEHFQIYKSFMEDRKRYLK